ncbi:MAG: hypothetical protein M3439_04100 [Chloroflexota bacterium]|nr:hypothetical protein [Chloroflexota bacterium]
MPVKDTAREAAFAAMRAARNDIMRVCREIHDDPEPAGGEQRANERLSALLSQHGFTVESGIAGLPTAFRATKLNHDSEAMRKGLRHGHVAMLVRADADPVAGHVDGTPTGLAAALGTAIGIGASLDSEFGAVTVIGYPGDGGLVAMAHAGVFDEFDAVLGARPAVPGEGYCHTIDGTGETMAVRSATVTLEATDARDAFVAAVAAEVAALETPNRIDVSGVDGTTVELRVTGRTSIELRGLSSAVQRLADGTPGAAVTFGAALDDTLVSRILARRVKTYSDTLGYKMDKIRKAEPDVASGWGSVSYATPTFLLNFPFTTEPVVRGVATFATVAAKSESYDRALEFSECLCMTGLDVLRDMQFRSISDDQLVKALAKRGITRNHRRWLGVHRVIDTPETNGKNGKKGPRAADFRMVRGPGMREN